MVRLTVEVNPAVHASDVLRKQARKDTLDVFRFIWESEPTAENIAILKSMLKDTSKYIDFDAICYEDTFTDGSLLTMNHHLEFKKLLLEAGASPEGQTHDPDIMPPLYRALRGCMVDDVKLLLEHGANPNRIWKTANGSWPTYRAIGSDSVRKYTPDLMKLLTEYGFNPNTMLRDEDSSWQLASGCDEKLSALLDLGGSLIRYNKSGSLILQPITHGRQILTEIIQQRRDEAFAFRDKFVAAVQPVLDGTQSPDQCPMLHNLTKSHLMMLSNVDALHLAFQPELWRGQEGNAVHLAHTNLYPYQQIALMSELNVLANRSIKTDTLWQDKVAAISPQHAIAR